MAEHDAAWELVCSGPTVERRVPVKPGVRVGDELEVVLREDFGELWVADWRAMCAVAKETGPVCRAWAHAPSQLRSRADLVWSSDRHDARLRTLGVGADSSAPSSTERVHDMLWTVEAWLWRVGTVDEEKPVRLVRQMVKLDLWSPGSPELHDGSELVLHPVAVANVDVGWSMSLRGTTRERVVRLLHGVPVGLPAWTIAQLLGINPAMTPNKMSSVYKALSEAMEQEEIEHSVIPSRSPQTLRRDHMVNLYFHKEHAPTDTIEASRRAAREMGKAAADRYFAEHL